jgi:hypothetical protein
MVITLSVYLAILAVLVSERVFETHALHAQAAIRNLPGLPSGVTVGCYSGLWQTASMLCPSKSRTKAL